MSLGVIVIDNIDKFNDGFRRKENSVAVLGHSFTTVYLLHLYFKVVMLLVNFSHVCRFPLI